MSRVYLITGVQRGLGRGMFQHYSQQPDTIVIGLVRTSAGVEAMRSITASTGSKTMVLQADVSDEAGMRHVADALAKQHGITKIDTVIASAGIAKPCPLADDSAANLLETLRINTVGPFITFESFWPLLQKSSAPKFVALSTSMGSIAGLSAFKHSHGVYGTSKAALNFLVAKIAQEFPQLIAFPVSPGWSQTDMGNEGANHYGMPAAPLTVDVAVKRLTALIDGATRADSGKFMNVDDEELQW